MFNNFFSENHDTYDKMRKNNVQPDRPQMTIWCTHIACQITEARDTHSEYAIIIAFPWQQQLHKHASVLSYSHIACLAI